jgi:hypothetical protein
LGVVKVLEYVDAQGREPYRIWIRSLDVTARVRVIATVLRMEGGNF